MRVKPYFSSICSELFSRMSVGIRAVSADYLCLIDFGTFVPKESDTVEQAEAAPKRT